MTSVITGAEVYLPLADLIDLNEEHARLEKEASKLEKEVERGEKKLSNERFVANAPAEVVNSEKEKLAATGASSKLPSFESSSLKRKCSSRLNRRCVVKSRDLPGFFILPVLSWYNLNMQMMIIRQSLTVKMGTDG